jgi:LacI family transcriptional regulator
MATLSGERLPDPNRTLTGRRVRIGVMVNNMGGYARGVLRGVASYAFARAWECKVEGVNSRGGLESPAEFDGWIIQALSADIAADLHRAGVPVVNISSALGEGDLPSVVSDDHAVGRTGADYFLRLGFRNFAFYSPIDRQFARLRHEGFSTRLRESSGHDSTLIRSAADLEPALFQLPRPLAVMASNDTSALTVLEMCRAHGVRVPDDVAILGVDDDDLIQSLAFPPLSSIHLATDRIGFEAAALMERLLSGQRPEAATRQLIPPTSVVTRQSTDVTATTDTDVAAALRFIRDHAAAAISVEDVARGVTISRRQLERRFRDTLGRTVYDEIKRCRIDRAKQLLAETELTLPQVAMASGFSTASYFTVVFGEETGSTPGVYRKQVKGR